jgi:hypothetical protein
MKHIIGCLFALIDLLHILACGKRDQQLTPTPLVDSVAQDPTYRLGKWYSVTVVVPSVPLGQLGTSG